MREAKKDIDGQSNSGKLVFVLFVFVYVFGKRRRRDESRREDEIRYCNPSWIACGCLRGSTRCCGMVDRVGVVVVGGGASKK